MAYRLKLSAQIFKIMKYRFLLPSLILSSFIILMAFVPPGHKKRSVKDQHLATVKKTAENPYYIIVDKSDYELKVYDAEGWYATYPIVFGSKDLSDKMKEGDKRTPNGSFKIILKKIHPKWGPELLLDYPNEVSIPAV